MSRVLYLDCFSGISGDMLLGAAIDLGLPIDELRRALGSLALERVEIGASRVLRAGVAATKFEVRETGARGHEAHSGRHSHTEGHAHDESHSQGRSHEHAGGHEHAAGHEHADGHQHKTLAEICALIDRSALSAAGRERAQQLFRDLAQVEAAVHDMPVERVHLHEVGAIDSIVDIVGAVFALEWLAADRVVCSPLNVGGGMIDSAHGRFPVPAPATLQLLTRRQAPVYSGPVRQELVTPTGALLATAYADSFGPMPPLIVERVGYGAGDRNPAETPNVLRLVVGRAAAASADRVTVVECEIDDMNPQIFGVVMDRLYAAGALEVFYVPVQMKKNRPGTLLTVIVPPALRPAVAGIIFTETTTIGVRYRDVERECLAREIVTVTTVYGPVRVKVAWRDGAVVNAVPEFDDCARLAAARQVPVKSVQAAAMQAYAALPRPARDAVRIPSGTEGQS
jgi:uncharacterized protein (TIGR00299 family) protein